MGPFFFFAETLVLQNIGPTILALDRMIERGTEQFEAEWQLATEQATNGDGVASDLRPR